MTRKLMSVGGMLKHIADRALPYRRPVIVLLHLGMFITAYVLAFLLRFDFMLPDEEALRLLETLTLLLAVRGTTFGVFRLYGGLWRYVSVGDLLTILKATTASSVLFTAAVILFFGHGFPRSVVLLDWLLCLTLASGVRLAIRVMRESGRTSPIDGRKRALVVGAGDAGEMLAREIGRNRTLNYELAGFVDDDKRKRSRSIHGISVRGTVDELPALVGALDIDEVLIATPSASSEDLARIVRRCLDAGVSFRSVPDLRDLYTGRARIGQLRQVDPAELLARDAVRLDEDRIRRQLHGRRVLVTGAGGSIGSELSRQVARFDPAAVVLLERAESSLYVVQHELRQHYPDLTVTCVVGDVCDAALMDDLFGRHRPDVVYHAAAYKHVPLMEDHPLEAIRNNVIGTRVLGEAAARHGAERFVFISTDKAVRPVGVMGMTKRTAECTLLDLNARSDTIFVAVRFGNVLGSDGSVLPLFRSQIANGAPVTVTHPEASRYFMLISEAAQLVLQAGVMGTGGEVYFLDMGQPIRILELAESFIRLSGLQPGIDVPLEVTGLRPGERLSEELAYANEELQPSAHEKILVVRGNGFDAAPFRAELAELEAMLHERDGVRAVAKLRDMCSRF